MCKAESDGREYPRLLEHAPGTQVQVERDEGTPNTGFGQTLRHLLNSQARIVFPIAAIVFVVAIVSAFTGAVDAIRRKKWGRSVCHNG